ncbi:MFS transporter [Streptomyces palmae]|uniref:MFS transporter n=1 Tax=Streptomyces palmae TaxID=1701085 RepID=A0A4Z0H6F1_9ACTN|nr:MFS transporter [Streptomyces palmae]TGB08357.1 MFS transporter [Streptomyces palmae]
MWSYAGGAVAARTGDEMSGPALLLAGLSATGSAAAASSLLAGLTVAAALGGPLLGALLDRSARPGRLLAGALGLYAAGLAAILSGLGRIPVPAGVLIAVGTGLLGPALSGGWTAQLPRVVPGDVLPRATALDAMTFQLAALLGPALAGVVAALCGAPAGVLVSAALICLALPSAWALPPAPGSAARRRAGSLTGDLLAGFRAIGRRRPLARATAVSVLSCAGQGMLIACAPLLGARALGGAGHGAVLLSAIAAAALAANAVLARRTRPLRPDTVLWGSTVLLAVASLLAAGAGPIRLVAAALLAGVAEGPQLSALFAIRHREAPPHLVGQVFTTGASLKITGLAVGAGLAGPLAAHSLPGALVAAAGCQVLAALLFAVITTAGRTPRATPPTQRPRPPE